MEDITGVGIIRAITGSISGSLSDQWKEIVTVEPFDELTAIAPGYLKTTNRGRGANLKNSIDVISNGSIIYIPENTAAIIYSQGYIENIITKPGGYEYFNGEKSIFNGDDILDTFFEQIKDRIRFGGISSQEKRISFVNLRELRGILFGTKGPQLYHDKYYDADLEIIAHGAFSLKITDVEKFLKYYLPANVNYYTFEDINTKAQILPEFLTSFVSALNKMSYDYRISELPSKSKEICNILCDDVTHVGTWEERFGIKVTNVAVEHIEFTEKSKELITQYNTNKMTVKAYESVSPQTSNIAAQQKIAEGVKEKGLGEGGAGMIFGMNLAQSMGTNAEVKEMPVARQMEILKNMKELLDAGVLTKEEFELKKKEVMGL